MPQGAPLVEVRNIVKRFGDETVLDGVSLTIDRGDTVVVIGGSGSGKSTLARMLTAYDVADRAALLANGKIVANGPPEIMFHSRNTEITPFALSSGLDLAALGPRRARKTAEEIRAVWEKAHPMSVSRPRLRRHCFSGARDVDEPLGLVQGTSS